MEPVTHFLTGAVLSRAGFNRRTAYSTLAMTLAAEAADLDIVCYLGGPVAGFEHHRGITHTLIGVPLVAAVVTLFVWLLHRFWLGRKRPQSALRPRWLLLWLFSVVAGLSHIFLDWTNNYGVRPFFPFNARWYSGDLVFIVEPVLLVILAGALLVPWLLRLAAREVGSHDRHPAGRGWAVAALLLVSAYWGWRALEHRQAISLAASLSPQEPALRLAAEPYPVNPFRWHLIAETSTAFLGAEANSRTGEVVFDPHRDSVAKPQVTMATLAAKRSYLGHIYLDWAQFPVVDDIGPVPVEGIAPPPASVQWTTVSFRDLRYAYQPVSYGLNMDQRLPATEIPLSAWAYVRNLDQVEAQIMSGKEQK